MHRLFILTVCLALGAPALAQVGNEDFPRYGTQSGDPQKGQISAKKYPGNLYGIHAFSNDRNMSAETLQIVSRQVMLRAAQLALENDRDYFYMFTPTTTQSAAETRRVGGIAPSTVYDLIPVPQPGMPPVPVARTIPGSAGYSYNLPRYEGAWTMVKLFTDSQKSERGSRPADGMTDFTAETVYSDLVRATPGRWPTLISIYEDLVDRSERTLKTTNSVDAKLTIINTSLKLSRLHREAGDVERGMKYLLRAGELIPKDAASAPR